VTTAATPELRPLSTTSYPEVVVDVDKLWLRFAAAGLVDPQHRALSWGGAVGGNAGYTWGFIDDSMVNLEWRYRHQSGRRPEINSEDGKIAEMFDWACYGRLTAEEAIEVAADWVATYPGRRAPDEERDAHRRAWFARWRDRLTGRDWPGGGIAGIRGAVI
jgi:hypothetical protein